MTDDSELQAAEQARDELAALEREKDKHLAIGIAEQAGITVEYAERYVKRFPNRHLQARVAAHTRWANTPEDERALATEKAREAFEARFERQVDPEGVLPPAERARRAEHARKAYFLGLALKSAKARRQRKQAASRQGS